jgi:hypothetical protein
VSFHLKFNAHCGMRTIDEEFVSREEGREKAATVLRRRRDSGHQVSTIDKGTYWECGEPEDCMMVPDTAGMLTLAEVFDESEEDNEWEDTGNYGEDTDG